MDWREILRLIPVVAGSVNPLAGVVATAIAKLADEEISRRRQADPGKSRDEIIAEAANEWQEGLDKAIALRKKGHE